MRFPRAAAVSALLALALFPSLSGAQSAGFAYDDCKAGQECKEGLECKSTTGTTACLSTSNLCRCEPTDIDARKCSASTTCIPGERCVGIATFDFNVCISCTSWTTLANATAVDRDGSSCLRSDTNYVTGYTGDACTDSKELPQCAAPRECYFVDEADGFMPKPCGAAESLAQRHACQCRDGDVDTCEKSVDCQYGERCVRNGTTNAFCLGCRAVELDIVLVPLDDDTSHCLLPGSTPSPSPAPPTSNNAPYLGGFAWDACTIDRAAVAHNISATCPQDHYCASSASGVPQFFGPPPCTKDEKACFCSFVRVRRCNRSTDCTRGERCVDIVDKPEKVCAGCQVTQFMERLGDWKPVDPDDNCLPRDASPSAAPSPVAAPVALGKPNEKYPRGFTFDACADDRDICREPRLCRSSTVSRPCGRDDTQCQCDPPGLEQCEKSSDCDGGERCASVVQQGNVCVACTRESEYALVDTDEANCFRGLPSPSPASSAGSSSSSGSSSSGTTPSPSPSPLSGTGTGSAAGASSNDGVCIGAGHLEKLDATELVFPQHRVAAVLCDAAGSCATSGHIVTFRGRAMRMRAYCDGHAGGGCVARRMAVNSPRWRAGRRVASLTDGLEFTALAARWDTLAEEHVLRGLVRLGA